MKASAFWLILLLVLAISITVFNHLYVPAPQAPDLKLIVADSTVVLPDSLSLSHSEQALGNDAFSSYDQATDSLDNVAFRLADQAPASQIHTPVYDIEVQKSAFKLILTRDGKPFKAYSVALGNRGSDKLESADLITPLGRFRVVGIENASKRNPHHGRRQGAWFIRLLTGHAHSSSGKAFSGIGIHGGGLANDMGHSLDTDCIVMQDSDLSELKGYIYEQYKQQTLYVRIIP